MKSREAIVLKAFLVSAAPEKREMLTRHLSDEKRAYLSDCPDIPIEIDEKHPSPFDHIHWSWFAPVIQAMEEKEQKLFLRALHPSIQKPIAQAIDLSIPTDPLTPLGAHFLRKTLVDRVQEDVLPIQFLPASPLNLLLQIEKKKLIQLVDFLSLYDLSQEIRQIVETKILNKIYSCLTDEERRFLKVTSHHKEPYIPVKVPLDNWSGTKSDFRKILHKIGLARLGGALADENEDLIWHICHRLDRGRGNALAKLATKKPQPKVAKWLSEQLKELI